MRDVKVFRRGIIGLDFQAVRPGLSRRLDDRQGALQRLVMVAGQLGDDEGRVMPSDPTVG